MSAKEKKIEGVLKGEKGRMNKKQTKNTFITFLKKKKWKRRCQREA
jgi:hypothetical protein